jgi:hypothetical protein
MKKLLLSALLVPGMLVGSRVMAYQGDLTQKGPNCTTERYESITQAFENNDYQAWKELMADRGGRVKEVINEGNFSKFVEMRKLANAGKVDEAKKIREELGLGLRNGRGGGKFKNR